MATAGVSGVLSRRILHVKGAPEFVLARCTRYLSADGIRPLDETIRAAIVSEFASAQASGCRTLAFACRELNALPEEFADAADSLIYLGFISIADPVRPEVPPAVQACREAGIDVKIVTGDTPGTAGEIGRQIGLWKTTGEIGDRMIEGRAFDALSEEETRRGSGTFS